MMVATWAARKYGTDWDGYCDMRAEAEYLRRSELEPDDPPEGEDE